jgi:hypothetical protein
VSRTSFCASEQLPNLLLFCPQLPLISALLSACLANTPAPPSVFLARGTDSLQDSFLEIILAFSGRPSGRPVSAPLRERAAPPPGISPARGPCLAAPPLGPVGPAMIPRSLSSTTVAAVVSAPLRERAAPPPGISPARGPCLAASLLGPVGPAWIPSSLSSRGPRPQRRPGPRICEVRWAVTVVADRQRRVSATSCFLFWLASGIAH